MNYYFFKTNLPRLGLISEPEFLMLYLFHHGCNRISFLIVVISNNTVDLYKTFAAEFV